MTPRAREHGQAGRERAVEKFSLSRMVRAYEALYEGEKDWKL